MDESQRWFWDGRQWCRLSPDGRWHWDGARWNPTPSTPPPLAAPGPELSERLKKLPRWLVWRWAAWFPCLVAWIPILYLAAEHHARTTSLIVLASVFGGAAVVSTVALGSSLGRRRAWGYLGWSILVGAVFLGLFLWGAAGASQPASGQDDQGAGLGAMLVLVACVIPVVLMLYVGGGLGALVRRIGRSKT